MDVTKTVLPPATPAWSNAIIVRVNQVPGEQAGYLGQGMTSKSPLTCVDLFAGCGGLSLGLKQAGFDVKLAVEKSPMAGETYFHNFIRPIEDPSEWLHSHGGLTVEDQARTGLVVRELADVLTSKEVISWLRESEIDLVAGGPPCQGFSQAGRRNPDDARNQLPWQFLSFIEKVEPKAVIIENVSGMRHDFLKRRAKSPFNDLRVALAETGPGYVVQPMLLNAMHFGAPQNRPRVFLVAVRMDLVDPETLYISRETWDSSLDASHVSVLHQRPHLAPLRSHFNGDDMPQHLTVRDAISDLCAVGYRDNCQLSDFALEMRTDQRFLKAGPGRQAVRSGPRNHVLRQHSEQVAERFRLYQFFREAGIHASLLSIPRKADVSNYMRRKLMFERLSGVGYPVRGGDGKVLAQDQRGLVRLLTKLSTNKHSQRALSWHKPAPTVLSLPDDFVHPSEPRIPTVRELARFQSFPDAFEFRSTETTGSHRRRFQVPQFTQVGNAVPPRLARAIGERLREVLTASSAAEDTKGEAGAVA